MKKIRGNGVFLGRDGAGRGWSYSVFMGRSWSFAAWFGLDRVGASQRSTGSFRFDQVEFRNCQDCSRSVKVGSGVVGVCQLGSGMVLLVGFRIY